MMTAYTKSNASLTNERIGQILTDHSIDWRIEDGRILAKDSHQDCSGQDIDGIKDMTNAKTWDVLRWLGY